MKIMLYFYNFESSLFRVLEFEVESQKITMKKIYLIKFFTLKIISSSPPPPPP